MVLHEYCHCLHQIFFYNQKKNEQNVRTKSETGIKQNVPNVSRSMMRNHRELSYIIIFFSRIISYSSCVIYDTKKRAQNYKFLVVMFRKMNRSPKQNQMLRKDQWKMRYGKWLKRRKALYKNENKFTKCIFSALNFCINEYIFFLRAQLTSCSTLTVVPVKKRFFSRRVIKSNSVLAEGKKTVHIQGFS